MRKLLPLVASLAFLTSLAALAGDAKILEGGIGKTLRSGALRLKVARLVEDSRCPAGSQCVWEGRVVLELLAEENGRKQRLKLQGGGDPAKFGSWTVSLASTSPAPVAGKTFSKRDYRFRLKIER